jgi:TonB family protein
MILAKLLDAGDGIARDAERAKRLLERACGLGLEEGCETACDAGSGSACVSLGNRLARAKEPDAGRIDHAYECACKAGAAAGCYYLGWRTTDPERSLPLFERACSLNDEAGCVAAAQCYQLGRGVEIDLAQAASLYAKACERGDASGCLYLGAIYARGELGASEAQKGKTYLTKACSCCDDVECRAIVANGGIPKSWGGSLEDLRPDRAGKGDWDQPPRLLRGTRPDYPPRAFQNRIQGTVMLEISIDEMGAVSEARVVESIPALDQAAIDCVQQWRFSPARRGGVAVPTLARAPITFSITDDHGRSSAGRK